MKCENCKDQHDGSYGSGRFCSSKCARGFSTKKNRKEINRKIGESLSKRAKPKVKKNCQWCKNDFEALWKKRNQRFCSIHCAQKFRSNDPLYLEKLSKSLQKAYSSIEARKRLKEIGRKGGFGTKGYTENGTYYQSLLEKSCFEYLEKRKISFEAHKDIPNSSKETDIYLIDHNVWIELDGINREKKKKWLKTDYFYWLEKMKIYEDNNLNVKIFHNKEEFIQFMEVHALVS